MTVCEDMFSRVLEIPPASQTEAQAYFSKKLSCETDPSDVYADLQNKKTILHWSTCAVPMLMSKPTHKVPSISPT
jgi:hypothetical protein